MKSGDPEYELRRRAEESAQETNAGTSRQLNAESRQPDLRMLHELQVHKIELEMQNDDLRRSLAELELSRERYFDLYETAPVGYITLDCEGLIAEANLTATTLLDCTRDEMIRKPLSSLVFGEDRDSFHRFRHELIETGERQSCELRMLKQDGSPLWVQLEATLAQDRKSLRVAVSDIAGRQRTDEALRESEASLRESQTVAGMGSYVLDIRTGLWIGSDVLDQVFGTVRNHGQRTSEEWTSLVHPDERQEMADYFANEVLRLGKTFDRKYRIIRPSDKVERWVHGLGRLEFDRDDKPVKLRGTIQDITDQKRMEDVQLFLARTSSWSMDEPFFKTLARYLSTSLQMEIVYIDRLDEDGLTARTLAVWADGQFGDNHSYALKDTPCGDLVGKIVRCFPAGVCSFFPHHQLLHDVNAESYVGVTLFSHTGRPIGLIAAVSRKVMTHRAQAEATLKLVAMRAAGEMERLDAEAAMERSEELYRSILNASPDDITITDLEGRITMISPAARRMFGLNPEDNLTGRLISEFTIKEDRERVAAYLKLMFEGKRPGPGEYRGRRADGSTFPLEGNGEFIRGADGKPTGMVFVIRDITERRQAEESHTRLATAVEQASETIVVTDIHGTILYVNPAFERTTGYTSEEAIGQNPRMLKSNQQDAEFYQNLWETLRRGEVWSGHFFNQRKDGSLYEEDATISPVRDNKGTIINYVAVKRDVTEAVQLQAQYRQSQKMEAFGQLAGGVAHDFNNILGSMMLQAEVTAMADGMTEEIRNGLQQIRTDATRAANLTRQLLLFSHKQVLQSRELDLNESVANLAKMLQRIIGEDVRLQLNLHPRPLLTHADAGMLDQLMMNLVINSRDAMIDGGRILIETTDRTFDAKQAALIPDAKPGRYVSLIVADDGCGIPPEIVTRIFEPFFTTKAPGKGTGLGLATVFGIVKQHGGAMQVDSEPGHGTTFRVFLPSTEAPIAPPAEDEKPKPRGGTETVLLVEDEPELRKLTAIVLSMHGYQVLQASHGVEALKIWANHTDPIHLLLTDMIMPEGIGGIALAKQLKELSPQLRIIFTSGYNAEISGRELSLEAGQNFIQKPASPLQLLATVRQCLDA